MPDVISIQEAKSLGSKQYYTGKVCPRGHDAPRIVSSRACTACARIVAGVSYRKTIVKAMLRKAKIRAARKGVPFSLVETDIHIPTHCPVLGWPLIIGNAPGTVVTGGQSPSLDRLIPELGYVPGNVLIVSNLANCIKHTATPDQILSVGNFYKKFFEDRAALAA